MTSGPARLLVWALAALTAALLAVTSVPLLSQWRDGAEASPGAAGPVLERHGVRVRLPAYAEVLAPRERLFYADPAGGVAAAVRGAALLVPGACPEVAGSSRGFVGVVRSRGTGAAAHDAQVRAWAAGLGAAVGEQPRALTVADERGRRTDLVARVRLAAPCQPERVRASLLTLLRDSRPVTVVLVRDVGAPDALDDGTAELLLAAVEVR